MGDGLFGSQFFFTWGSDLTSLDGIHWVIGKVVEGFDVLRAINEDITDTIIYKEILEECNSIGIKLINNEGNK